jgi:rare lipoprotein A
MVGRGKTRASSSWLNFKSLQKILHSKNLRAKETIRRRTGIRLFICGHTVAGRREQAALSSFRFIYKAILGSRPGCWRAAERLPSSFMYRPISGSQGAMGLGKGRFSGVHLTRKARLVSGRLRARVVPRAVALRIAALAGLAGFLAGCAGVDIDKLGVVDPRYGMSSSARIIPPGEPIPKGGGTYRVGPAYAIGGKTYVPAEDHDYRAEGLASWYGEDFHGHQTANGEIFDMNSMSAAHTTLPMPTYVRVTNLENNKSVIVRVNDRGPYHADRIIDVSVKAAQLLGFYSTGVARVRVEYVGTAPLEGSDDNMLIATLRQGQPAPAPSLVRVAAAKPMTLHNVPVPPERPWGLGQGDGPGATYLPASAATGGDPRPPPIVPPTGVRSFN